MAFQTSVQCRETDQHDDEQKADHHRYVRPVFAVGHADLLERFLREPEMAVRLFVQTVERFATVTVNGHDQSLESVPHVADVGHVVQQDGHVVEEHQKTGEQYAQTGDDRPDEHAVLKHAARGGTM